MFLSTLSLCARGLYAVKVVFARGIAPRSRASEARALSVELGEQNGGSLRSCTPSSLSWLSRISSSARLACPLNDPCKWQTGRVLPPLNHARQACTDAVQTPVYVNGRACGNCTPPLTSKVSMLLDRKSTRLNSSHTDIFRMPSSA